MSQIGQFEAEMSSDSFQLLGMAERGFLPACLARRSRHGTPTLAIILSSVGICTLSMFDFRQVSANSAEFESAYTVLVTLNPALPAVQGTLECNI